ncbi:MAG: PH domain-containing protein [Verrucomicrobiae bacterium]|nr:PH domain-containing protein [Verrucomicrobiae bacterium]
MNATFKIVPVPQGRKKIINALLGILLLMMAALPVAVLSSGWSKPVMAVGASVIILLALAQYFLMWIDGSDKVTYTVTGEHLRVAGDAFFTRTVPRGKIRAGEAKILNLHQDREYALGLRVGGTGLFYYNAGWFLMGNRERVFACVTDPTRVVYLPVEGEPALLLTVDRPEELIQSLRAVSG